jgi:hypothetical protein
MLALYIVTIYVKPDRYAYLKSTESLNILVIISPILLINDVSMLHPMYMLVGVSRYIRILYLVVVLHHYHENQLGETDVDR